MKLSIVVFAVIAAAGLPLAGANLLVNGGFEDTPPAIPDDPIPGWTMVFQDWTGMTDYHWTVQDADKYSGSYALHLYMGPEAWGASWGVYQAVTVGFNKVYEARASWKCINFNPAGNQVLNFFVFLGTLGTYSGPGPIAEPRVMDPAEVYAVRSTQIAWGHPAFLPMPTDWESTKDAPFTSYPPNNVQGTAQYRSRIRAMGTKLTVYFRFTGESSRLAEAFLDEVVVEEVNAAFSVYGKVKDASTNQPIAGAVVTISAGGSATTNATGDYTIYYPDAGACNVTVTAAHYYDSVVAANLTARSDNLLNLFVTPKPTGTLTGTISDSSGPVPNADVWTDTGGYSTKANGSGVYTIQVEAGSYMVSATAPGYETATAPATVYTGQPTVCNLTLTLRYVNPANALTNGDFEGGTVEPWTVWAATHFTDHRRYDPTCPHYVDQWVGDTLTASLVPGQGVGGSTGAWLGLVEGTGWGACGGLRQECYVTPGKWYRARAAFRGEVAPDALDYQVGIGLMNGRFDPGVYAEIANPPAHVDDVVLMVAHPDQYFGSQPSPPLPEPQRWWHNLMEVRSRQYDGISSWDWESTMDYIAPRNYLVSGIKQATGDRMTVALYSLMLQWDRPSRTEYGIFDDVVLEEVPPPGGVADLGDISRCDFTPPYAVFPEGVPQMEVDLSNSANAKVVTGVFTEPNVLTQRYCYIEELNRSTGIRVDLPEDAVVSVGDTITLVGILGWTSTTVQDPQDPETFIFKNLERRIIADLGSVQVVNSDQVLPAPLFTTNRDMSAKYRFLNPMGDTQGPANAGLLGTVCGRVLNFYESGDVIWLQIDDGTRTETRIEHEDGSVEVIMKPKEVWLRNAPYDEAPDPDDPNSYGFLGKYVTGTGVIGISLTVPAGYPVMVVQIRDESITDDFAVLQ